MTFNKIIAYIYKTTRYKCSCICWNIVQLFSKSVFMLPSTETSSYNKEMLG